MLVVLYKSYDLVSGSMSSCGKDLSVKRWLPMIYYMAHLWDGVGYLDPESRGFQAASCRGALGPKVNPEGR